MSAASLENHFARAQWQHVRAARNDRHTAATAAVAAKMLCLSLILCSCSCQLPAAWCLLLPPAGSVGARLTPDKSSLSVLITKAENTQAPALSFSLSLDRAQTLWLIRISWSSRSRSRRSSCSSRSRGSSRSSGSSCLWPKSNMAGNYKQRPNACHHQCPGQTGHGCGLSRAGLGWAGLAWASRAHLFATPLTSRRLPELD